MGSDGESGLGRCDQGREVMERVVKGGVIKVEK